MAQVPLQQITISNLKSVINNACNNVSPTNYGYSQLFQIINQDFQCIIDLFFYPMAFVYTIQERLGEEEHSWTGSLTAAGGDIY
jgi:hypothetical protein